jgi:hypothetical protein
MTQAYVGPALAGIQIGDHVLSLPLSTASEAASANPM